MWLTVRSLCIMTICKMSYLSFIIIIISNLGFDDKVLLPIVLVPGASCSKHRYPNDIVKTSTC